MSYDQSCYDLAAAFLADHPEKNTEANRDELAQHIQTEIGDWIEFILLPTGVSTLSPSNEDVGSPKYPPVTAGEA